MKTCNYCGKKLNRKVNAKGQLEAPSLFKKRSHCDLRCAAKSTKPHLHVKKVDFSGRKIHRWSVIREVESRGHRRYYLCQCDCGTEKVVALPNLQSGKTKSCGCLRKEIAREVNTKHGDKRGRGRYSSEYVVWCHMKSRCCNPREKRYKDYGGRGIGVCERWLNSYENFLEDMGRKPFPSAKIERIDNDKGYSPDNCRWASNAEQSRNRRSNVVIEYQGREMVLSDWAKELGIAPATLSSRLKVWPVEKAFTEPIQGTRK